MKTFSPEVIAYAASKGIDEDELPLIIDGCSGGLSWLYNIGGKTISCEDCCNCHDIDYQLGGTEEERKDADKRLRDCSARAGSFNGLKGQFLKAWRWTRAWIMYAAVRLFAKSHWA